MVERRLRVPGDKSISHRALILAALSAGTSRIRGILQGADVASTAAALRALGTDIGALGETMTVQGRRLGGLRRAEMPLDCGNSGTTARLLAGVLAGHAFASRLVGDASLSRRPMKRVAAPLRAMGARVDLEGDERLPMSVHGGALSPIDWRSETASAQVKSAILLAALVGRVAATVREPARSRDHTERMLDAMGVPMRVDAATVSLEPVDEMRPLDLDVPGDPSSAAFFAGWALLAGRELLLPDISLNPTRIGFLQVLGRMGARVEAVPTGHASGEPVGDLRVSIASLAATDIGGDEIPSLIDELPLLACVAARASGTTTIRGAAELRVKESDRISTVVANLRAIGVEADELDDGMRIEGSARPLRGAVRTFGDHRLAMAFGVLAALPDCEIVLDDPACVAVSYPGFFQDLRHVGS